MHGAVVPHARGSACVARRQRHDERAALANHAPADEHVAAQEASELPVWRYATRLLASNAAVATFGLARVLVNRPFLRRIFGSRDGIHGRLDGPISAMIENRTWTETRNALAA